MINISNVLFVLFLFCFVTPKQLQGQSLRLPVKDTKEKIAELINEMIPKALQAEGLLEQNFTKKLYTTVVDDITNNGLLAQAKKQQTKVQAPKVDLKTIKEARELIETVLSDNVTEQSKENDKNGETAIRKRYKMIIRKPEQIKEEQYPQEPESEPEDKEQEIITQPENTTNTTQNIQIEEPLQNKTEEQIPIQQPQLPLQPESPSQQPELPSQSEESQEVVLAEEPGFKPLFPKQLVRNIYNKFLGEINESGLACKKKKCQKP